MYILITRVFSNKISLKNLNADAVLRKRNHKQKQISLLRNVQTGILFDFFNFYIFLNIQTGIVRFDLVWFGSRFWVFKLLFF